MLFILWSGVVLIDSTHIIQGYFIGIVAIKNYLITINTLRLRQNGSHFPDDIFLEWRLLYFDENVIEICSSGSN